MPANIIERPPAICMSKNELRYVVQFGVVNPESYLLVYIWYHAANATTATADPFTMKLKPNSDGKVYIYVHQYIDSILNYDIPTGNTPVTHAENQTCKFWITTKEIEPNVISLENTIEESHKRLAIKMGVEKNRYSRDNLVASLLANKQFFTYQVPNRLVFIDQPLFLSFLASDGDTSNIVIRSELVKTSGVFYTLNTNFPSLPGYFFHLNVSPSALGYSVSMDDVLYWEVKVFRTGSNFIIADDFRFYKDYKPLYYYRDLVYTNSLSGIDTIRVAGAVMRSLGRSFQESDGGMSLTNSADLVKVGERSQQSILLTKKFKGDIGYRESPEDAASLVELLAAAKKYMLYSDRLVPVLVTETSKDLFKSNDTKWSFPIDIELADQNEVFTPDDVNLQVATDNETYVLRKAKYIINNTNAISVLVVQSGSILINTGTVAQGQMSTKFIANTFNANTILIYFQVLTTDYFTINIFKNTTLIETVRMSYSIGYGTKYCLINTLITDADELTIGIEI